MSLPRFVAVVLGTRPEIIMLAHRTPEMAAASSWGLTAPRQLLYRWTGSAGAAAVQPAMALSSCERRRQGAWEHSPYPDNLYPASMSRSEVLTTPDA
jgi:hypothetical protein